MGSRSNTIITRIDENGKQLEASKCLYQHSGYDNASNVATILAFYDDGKYFAKLPKEQQDMIGRLCFKHNPNFHTLDDKEFFRFDLHGTADVFLNQNGKDKYACVLATIDHIVWLHERPHYVWNGATREFETPNYSIDIQELLDVVKIDGKTYEREANEPKNILLSIEDYFKLSAKNYPDVSDLNSIIENFVKNENIQKMSSHQYKEFYNIKNGEFVVKSINNEENLEKTLLLNNTFLLKYSAFAENENIDFYKSQGDSYEQYGQFLKKDKLAEYPFDKELASLINVDLPQNDNQTKTRKHK